jgi:outer membrane protein assembly factor BamB
MSATDGRLVVGVSRPAETAGPILMCHDIESGGVEWQATVPAADRDDPARGGPLAVSDGRCVAGYSGGDAVSGTDAVVCRAVGDGEPLWQVGTDGPVTDIAVVGDGVIFGTKNGIVRAVDLETGTDRWRVDLVVRVHALAPVDGTVFVASRGGQVFAVR